VIDDGLEPDEQDGDGLAFNATSDTGVRVLARLCATCVFRADSAISRAQVAALVPARRRRLGGHRPFDPGAA